MACFFHKGSALIVAIAVLAAVQCSQTCAFGDCDQISSHTERKSKSSDCHQHGGDPSKPTEDQPSNCSHNIQSDKVERGLETSVKFAPSYQQFTLDDIWTNCGVLYRPQYSSFLNLKAIPPLINPVVFLTTILRV